MAIDSNAIANQAIYLMGDDQPPPVTGQWPSFDDSPAGQALNILYGACMATVQRQWGWDASRNMVTLAQTGNAGPFPPPFGFEFLYPTNGIQVWQLVQTVEVDPNDPQPYNYSVGNTLVTLSGVQTQKKVIWAEFAAMAAIYNNNPTEAVMDPMFLEAFRRLLSSELAMALAGKPDTSQSLLNSASSFETLGEARGD